ncbi:LuxR C-terminal-related transcriptional regulator [Pseudomonas panipatensis]|uniref:LuxR family transcriptional regulator, maltose regulon positive regulatory protein n=1 Tax=Pseudomonas panipatensis TaxID=428992 RepID=A0A1G8E5Q4_9PSED|nr:LuxR C-terminal-related transcriptional regulator [Pseudomonas panipatensis]SDH65184.1 LuxR family transcriptional regulator, maltose regulon positive regulatory protein [Pseudomonas panipatensis]SMP38413.1 LuxR family transcriptional regulator, maltose regulon positive regulatory protein [Pseudomonas panipatensis]
MTDFSTLPAVGDAAMPVSGGRFYRPPLPAGYVYRPRLCERLRAGLGGRLLLVSAPAGFGKSSLAIEFCESLGPQWRSLWLGVSARDGDPGRFLERLLEGLRLYHPNLGDDAMALLKMRQRHQPFAFEAWLDDLLDELSGCLSADAPLLLVLDDYHLAQGAVLDRCLQFLLNHLPDGLLLLVTSRQRPDWHLARLRLSRQLLELAEHDLRLTGEETAALISASGARIDEEIIERLIERSEGWIAGLRLWLLAHPDGLSERGCEVPLSGAEELIRDYLLEEVIDKQPAEVQAFLQQTARFERFCPELCDALRDAHDSAAILQHLQRHQVFLVPLDEQGRWFRYHHLFSDLLLARELPASGPSAASLHLRACRWFSSQGMLDEAVDQALRAGHPEVAASLVQSLSEEQLLAEQNVATLLRWKMDLPDSLLASTPRLIVLYGWALALACQLDAAEELAAQLARFLPAADAVTQADLLAQWQALAGVIARGRGDIESAERHCGEALASLPAERSGPRLLCLSSLSNLAIVRGDGWRARALNREALEQAQRFGNPLFEALVHYDRARGLQARGELRRADEELELGLARLSGLPAHRRYAVRGRLLIYQGYLRSLGMQTEEARKRLKAGIDEARACRDVSLVIGYAVLACLEGQQGQYTQAFAQLAEVERLMHVWDVPPVFYLSVITLIKCELWLGQGQLELAAAWLERLGETYSGEQPATPPECHPQLPYYIALWQALLARHEARPEEAERRLRSLIVAATRVGAHMPVLQAQGQLICLLLQDGREEEACGLLEASLRGAMNGALQPLHVVLEQEPEWLREQLLRRPPCPLQQALLARLPALPERPGVCADGLSGRELAVLELIAQGCSNQQISERLYISLHTVKSHARHINDKLGVERRTQAVARAKALGLLR